MDSLHILNLQYLKQICAYEEEPIFQSRKEYVYVLGQK